MTCCTRGARFLTVAAIAVVLAACPGFGGSAAPAQQETAGTGATVDAGNSGNDAASADALTAAEAKTESERFGAPPTEETLCMLHFGNNDDPGSDLGGVKALLGAPSEEATAKTDGGLEYLYADGQSIFFAFKWRDEVCVPSLTCNDVFPTYYLVEANVTMMAYPDCWPHKSAD